MRFELNIALGNEAMRTRYHVAKALRRVAMLLEAGHAHPEEESHKIQDMNGNSVGSWDFTSEDI